MTQTYFDRQSGRWLPGHIDASGNLVLSSEPPPAEKTVARLNLFATIENDDSDRPGIRAGEFIAAIRAVGPVDELHVYIDSNGGHCRAMAEIMDAMLSCRAGKIVTHCVGKAFSAACCIFLMGHERRITTDGALMMHDVTAGGNPDHPKALQYSELIAEMIAVRADQDIETVREWMSRETYVPAASALALGMATAIDFDAGRVGVDTSHANKPFPIDDDHKLKRTAMTSRAAELLQEADELEDRRTAREIARAPTSIPLPPFPESLRDRAVYSHESWLAMKRRLNQAEQAAASGTPADPMELVRLARMRRIVEGGAL